MLFCPDCSTVIRGAPRLVGSAPRRIVSAPRLAVGTPRLVVGASRVVVGAPRLVTGAPEVLSGAPKCSQTSHNHSYGTPVPVIRDPSYSEGQPECPPMVWYSPEIDTSKFTLHILSDTPGGSQWLKYILLMYMWAWRGYLDPVTSSWLLFS